MSAPMPISDNGIASGGGGGSNTGTNGGPVMWPRRTTKACASCRRDKIRCDGGRPCGACAKKGYAADQCTDGCDPCRRARVRCEDGSSKPCRRCLEMKIECVDGPTISMYHGGEPLQGKSGLPGGEDSGSPTRISARLSGTADQSAQTQLAVGTSAGESPTHRASSIPSPSSPTRSTGGRGLRSGERAKLACVSCRRDNKKCDDNRPCSRCIARSEQCIHVNRGPKLVKLRCEGCREENKRCEETRPCKYCVENDKECVVVPRKGRGHGTRVKAACMNCRRDKVRCNGDRPCAACTKKGCDCVDRPCSTCTRDGKPADCAHRRTVSLEMSPTEQQDSTPIPPQKEAPKPAVQREKDFRFVPSQDDSRWLSYAANNQAQSSTVVAQPSAQAHTGLVPSSFYYPAYPHANPHFPNPYTLGPPGGYPQPTPNPAAFFFDVLDPSLGNFPLSQHMSSTSSSRTFLPDD